jgi:hypothetical protein
MSAFWIKYGHIFYTREFKKLVLRTVWKIAKKNPEFKQILIERGIPRRLPSEKNYFVPARPKLKKQIHWPSRTATLYTPPLFHSAS